MKQAIKLLTIVVFIITIGFLLEKAIDITGVPNYIENTFEVLAELFSVFVAFSIFAVTWHAYSESKDNHALFLGAAFLFVGLLILFHMLSYPFMPIFITPNTSHKAAIFLLESRFILAISFLASAYIHKDTLSKFINKRILLSIIIVFSTISLIFILLYHSVLFSEIDLERGYPPAIILMLFLVTAVILYACYLYTKKSKETEQNNLIYLIYGSIIIAVSNLVYFSYEFSGHFLITTGFFFIYLSLYKSSVELPYKKLAIAEEKLRKGVENKYRDLFDNTNDAIITIDLEDRITLWNRSAEKIFGWEAQEVIGKKLSPLIVPDDLREKREQLVRNALTGTEIIEVETLGLHKDGSNIDVSLTISPILNTDRKIIGMSEIFRDIRERKHIEKEKDKLLKAIDNSNDGIIIADEKDRYIYLNKAYAKIYGYFEEELIGKTWREITHPEMIAPAETILYNTLYNKEIGAFSGGFLGLRKDGTAIPIEVRGKALWDEKGSYQGHICIVRDITARKQVEEKLLLFRNLIDKSIDAIFVNDPGTGRILDINDRACINLGYKREELLNMSVLDFEINLPDQFSWKEHVKEVQNRGYVLFEGRHRRKDGTTFPAEINVSFIVLGKISYMVAVVRDITERKLAEDKIKRSLLEKETLLKEIHHRVKNNLLIVSSLLDHQARYIKDKNVIDIFTESQNRIASMSLVHEKLYQSKDLAKIDFNEYINDLVANLFQSYVINFGKITLNMDIQKIQLDIDFAIPCGLIINELVTNSLKYAFPADSTGEIKIAFRKMNKNENEDENMLEFVIGDNGIGLPKDLDFRKTDSLGLHLVTTLAENQLHGEINLIRNEGTEFQIKFRGIK